MLKYDVGQAYVAKMHPHTQRYERVQTCKRKKTTIICKTTTIISNVVWWLYFTVEEKSRVCRERERKSEFFLSFDKVDKIIITSRWNRLTFACFLLRKMCRYSIWFTITTSESHSFALDVVVVVVIVVHHSVSFIIFFLRSWASKYHNDF